MATLDDEIEGMMNESSAASEAVKHLITVEENEHGKASKVETKTDLSDDDVKIHSVLAILDDAIMKKKADFDKTCILGALIERKERKLISKNHLSRTETVNVARQPDMPILSENANQVGILRRMFTPKRQ